MCGGMRLCSIVFQYSNIDITAVRSCQSFYASLVYRIGSMSYLADEYNLHNIFVKWEPSLRAPSSWRTYNAFWPGELTKLAASSIHYTKFFFFTDDSFSKVSLNCSLDENE